MQRKGHWEQVYATRAVDEVSWFQPDPNCSMRLIQAAKIGKTEPLIDIGGGASRLVDALMDADYVDLSVLDISGRALTLTQDRLSARASRVQWLETDVTAFTPPRRYALWHDRAVFHFLVSKADRELYKRRLEHGLRPGGHLIIATFALDGPERCSNLPVRRYSVDRLAAELGAAYQLQESLDEIHLTPAKKEQRFVYCRFQKL